MPRIKDGNYIGVQAFMVRDLHLKGNELLIYALIYGFTQAECQKFTGSLSYIADWTCSTKRGVIKNLRSLIEKGLIQKNEITLNGVRYCEYYATEFTTSEQRSTESGAGYGTLKLGGSEQSSPKTIDNKTIVNRDSIDRRKGSEFTPPTIEQVRTYCEERNNGIDPEHFIDYYASVGWVVGKNKPMKDWKAAVRNWENKRKAEAQPKHFNGERQYDDDFFKRLEERDK